MDSKTRNQVKMMSFADAMVILQRKWQDGDEFQVARIALLTLRNGGMNQKQIEVEARRKLSFPEVLVLAEFE